MSAEYNSKLISILYRSDNEKELIQTLDEVGESNDPVFLDPLIDAYHKHINTSFGHYFLSSLRRINSEEIERKCVQLLNESLKSDGRADHISWILSALEEHEIFPRFAVELAKCCLENYRNKEFFPIDNNDFDLSAYLSFSNKAKALEPLMPFIQDLFFDETLDRDEKTVALRYFLKINPSKQFDFIIESYDDLIKNKPEEIILAKVLETWTGTKVDQLRDKIIKKGQNRAREIVEKQRQNKKDETKKQEEQIQQKHSVIYGNSEIVNQIRELRRTINTKTLSNSEINFKLLPDNELILDQIQSADEEAELVSVAVNLRSLMQDLNSDINNHGLEKSLVDHLLVGVEETHRKGSLNQLFLFLNAKGLTVDHKLFGFKKVNRVCSLIAHPEKEKEFLDGLKELGVLQEFKDQDWQKIHKKILELYLNSLKELNSVLK